MFKLVRQDTQIQQKFSGYRAYCHFFRRDNCPIDFIRTGHPPVGNSPVKIQVVFFRRIRLFGLQFQNRAIIYQQLTEIIRSSFQSFRFSLDIRKELLSIDGISFILDVRDSQKDKLIPLQFQVLCQISCCSLIQEETFVQSTIKSPIGSCRMVNRPFSYQNPYQLVFIRTRSTDVKTKGRLTGLHFHLHRFRATGFQQRHSYNYHQPMTDCSLYIHNCCIFLVNT